MNEIQTVIAFDFGLRRIGVAAGDTLTRTAAPRPAVNVGAHGPDWNAIGASLRHFSPQLLVLGAPYNVDGSAGALGGAADALRRRARNARFGLPVARVDERYSSHRGGRGI